MGDNCLLQVTDLVNLIESGAEPYPLMYSGQGCSGVQFPKSGDEIKYNWTNVTFTKDQMCASKADIGTCLPGLQAILVPPGYRITFQANADAKGRVHQLGQYDISYVGAGSAQNQGYIDSNSGAWKVVDYQDGSTSSTLHWHAPDGSGAATQCDTGTVAYECYISDQNSNYFYTKDTESKYNVLKKSLVSCGSTFWPSFASVQADPDTHQFVTVTVNNVTRWYDAGIFNPPGSSCTDWQCCRETTGCNPGTFCNDWGGNARYAYTTHNPAITEEYCKTCSDTNITYNTTGCLTNMKPMTIGDNGLTDTDGCGYMPDGTSTCAASGCSAENYLETSVDTVQVLRTVSWTQQQVDACTGKPLVVGNITIQRYGQSTPACDQIMEEFCSNTANLIDPLNVKKCSCILEQKRIEAQFAGLDLPVQCFASICTESDPQVYKTTNQSQGCSAKLCTQILNVDGSAIASKGFSSILCDGSVYHISTQPSASQVPLVSPNLSSGSVELGPVFYIALGVLVLMVTLLIAYIIRRVVIQRRSHQIARQRLTKLLEQDIS